MQTMGRFLLMLGVASVASAAFAQSTSKPTPDIAVVNGNLGRCSLELTVNLPDGKPAYGATVKVHIAYGFGGFHKLDLEGGTNAEGKVKFTGLPTSVRRPPLEFEGSKDDLEGVATYDPAAQCHAQQTITLGKPKPSEEK